jgi:hypothetical protein
VNLLCKPVTVTVRGLPARCHKSSQALPRSILDGGRISPMSVRDKLPRRRSAKRNISRCEMQRTQIVPLSSIAERRGISFPYESLGIFNCYLRPTYKRMLFANFVRRPAPFVEFMTPQVSVSCLKDNHRRQRNLEMKKTPLSLQSAHPRNFKAVRNSRAVKFAPRRGGRSTRRSRIILFPLVWNAS